MCAHEFERQSAAGSLTLERLAKGLLAAGGKNGIKIPLVMVELSKKVRGSNFVCWRLLWQIKKETTTKTKTKKHERQMQTKAKNKPINKQNSPGHG